MLKNFENHWHGNHGYLKKVLMIALPMIIQGLVIQFQTLINRAFLGNLKVEYLAAVGNTIFPFYATITVVIAVSTGLTILIAQNIGAKQVAAAKEYLHNSIFYSSILALILFVLWFFFPGIIFAVMGVDKVLMGYCVGYVRIISFFLILLGIDISIQAALQGAGITKPIMYSGLARILCNVLLDWIFIFGHLGFPKMGLYGAALATAISNIAAIMFLLFYSLKSKRLPFKINLREVFGSKNFDKFKDVLRVGLPTGFESLIWYIGILLFLRILNHLDELAVGIYTLIYGIDIAVYGIYNGLARASLTLVGNKIGEENETEAKKVLTSCLKYNYVVVGVIFLVFLLYSKQILGIFTKDVTLIDKSVFFFIIMSFTLFPRSLNVIVGSGIRGFGDTKWMLYTQILGTVFVITFANMAVFVFQLGITGIYITIFMDEFFRSVLNSLHFYKHRKVCAYMINS